MRWTKLFILLVVLFTACINSIKNDLDKIGSTYWEPELAFPVLNGEFNLGDYLDAVSDVVTITEDANGLVVIEYSGPDVTSDKAEDMISVPDQSYTASLGFDAIEVAGLPVSLTLTKSAAFDFVVTTDGGDELDSMVVKSGILDLGINGDFPASGQVEIVFSPIRLNGNVFSKTYSWVYNPANPGQSFQESIDLSGAFIDFSKNQTTTNNFNFEIRLTINYEGQPITTGNSININLFMANPKFQVVYGRFSQRTFVTPRESVLIGLLENVSASNFYLDNPQVELNFKSSFGLPVLAQLNSLVAYNSKGDSLAFNGPIINNATSVASPDINQVGTYLETRILITKDNSNITDIISFLPTEFAYQFSGSVEPQGSVSQFVLDTSQVIGSYKVILPLSGTLSNFDSELTFDFNGADLDQLKKTRLIAKTVNGLPLNVGLSLVFLDANDLPLDTLFNENNILNSGILDPSGFVSEPTETYLEEILSEDQIVKLQAAKKIVMRSTLYTGLTGNEVVKVRTTDKVTLSLFAQSTYAN